MLHWILYLTYYYTTLGLKYFLLFRLFQFSGYGFGDVSKLLYFGSMVFYLSFLH